jgi:hypothetical protein
VPVLAGARTLPLGLAACWGEPSHPGQKSISVEAARAAHQRRATLKTDAEILERLDPNSAAYKSPKQSIEARVERLSAEPQNGVILFDVALGVIFFVGFGFWTANIVWDGFSGWALLTGYLTLSGAGFVLLGFSGCPKGEPSPDPAVDTTPSR